MNKKNNINVQNQESKILKDDEDDQDQEEAVSLSDFPLIDSDAPEKKDAFTLLQRRPPSHPSDSFEFFNDPNSDNVMSHAEDIISCGKLMPYKQQSFFDDQILKSMSEDYDSIDLSRRYCDSLPELNPTRSSNRKSLILRSSRSLDDSKQLRRNSSLVMKSEASGVHRSSSKGSVKSEGYSKGSKPRWYGLMFGLKFPPEIDLRDMKSRQVRRNPGRMFPVEVAGGGAPADRRSSWGHDLLRVLSCKNQPSVSVTASIRLVPQA